MNRLNKFLIIKYQKMNIYQFASPLQLIMAQLNNKIHYLKNEFNYKLIQYLKNKFNYELICLNIYLYSFIV